MLEDYHISQIPLQYALEKDRLKSFLDRHALRYEEDIEAAFGIFNMNDELAGCGCASGALLKCFAVEERLRGQNALGLLLSALMRDRFSKNFYELYIITRAYNEALFRRCGFFTVVKTASLVMLENTANGPEAFAASLGSDVAGINAGAVVMNCNPFTLGHRSLIERAAKRCDLLHIFVVEEDRSLFPTQIRFRLVREGTEDLPNVRVHLSGRYMISAATFPCYFLKQGEDAATLQSELDITLFARRIAPALHIVKRFAGEEPFDLVTARYNNAMRLLLPKYGIEFCELPRYAHDGVMVSASHVRSLLEQPDGLRKAAPFLPETTRRYLEQQRGNAIL